MRNRVTIFLRTYLLLMNYSAHTSEMVKKDSGCSQTWQILGRTETAEQDRRHRVTGDFGSAGTF